MMPINIAAVVQDTLGSTTTEGRIWNEGRSSFEHKRAVALRKRLWGLRKSGRQLCTLGQMQRMTHFGGKRAVRIDDIWGSENRVDEFDIDFLPVAEHLEDRWVNVWMAFEKGIALPPVELIAKDGGYYVRDGHHRISVARALGFETIEAIVTEILKVE